MAFGFRIESRGDLEETDWDRRGDFFFLREPCGEFSEVSGAWSVINRCFLFHNHERLTTWGSFGAWFPI